MGAFWPFHSPLTEKYHKFLVIEAIQKHAQGKLLDIGCGKKPFKHYASKVVSEHIGLDHAESPHGSDDVNVVGVADNLPFEQNSFDTVLMTQVIEHLENPSRVFSEIYRVLKPNGKVIVAWPFLYPIHEAPRDFYRYTKYGMKHLAGEAGLELIELKAASGFWISWFSFLSIYIYGKSRFIYGLLSPLLLLLKWICLALEAFDKNQESKEKWTWNYCSIMKKTCNEA